MKRKQAIVHPSFFVLTLASIMSLLILCAAIIVSSPSSAWGATAANSKTICASSGEQTTYSKMDIDRDGAKDSVTLSVDDSTVRVFVNDKRVYSFDSHKHGLTRSSSFDTELYAEIKLMKMSSGRAFAYLHVAVEGTGYWRDYVLAYEKGKLTKVLDANKVTKGTGAGRHYVSGIKAKGNRIVIHHSASVGKYLEASYSYKYKNKKLVRTSKTGAWLGEKKVRSMRNNLPVYKSPKCKGITTRLKEGQKVRISKIYLNGGRAVVKVKTSSGKTGWVKVTDNSLDYLTFL